MKQYRILFAIAEDQPGIVHEVSAYLKNRGANIEDSRMAAMGGRFTATVLFSGPADSIALVLDERGDLEATGKAVSFHEADDPANVKPVGRIPLRIRVQALDNAGIVNSVVDVLYRHQVNVESMDTHVSPAPFYGGPIFHLDLLAGVPAERSIMEIKEELERLARRENLDMSFPIKD